MNLDRFNLPNSLFSRQTFSSFFCVLQIWKAVCKNMVRFICSMWRNEKYAICNKKSLNSSFAFNVNGSKNIISNVRPPTYFHLKSVPLCKTCGPSCHGLFGPDPELWCPLVDTASGDPAERLHSASISGEFHRRQENEWTLNLNQKTEKVSLIKMSLNNVFFNWIHFLIKWNKNVTVKLSL